MSERINRYAIFANEIYYASGGWNDFRAFTDNRETAIKYADELLGVKVRGQQSERIYIEWTQVIDLQTGLIIHRSGGHPHGTYESDPQREPRFLDAWPDSEEDRTEADG